MSRVRNSLAIAVGSVVAVAALAIPALTYVRLEGPDLVLDRHGAPDAPTSAADLQALVDGTDLPPGSVPSTGRPLILGYHDVRPDVPDDDRYTVTPAQLADHLALLRTLGYESITVDQLIGWLDGDVALPERPVLLTFDDGPAGLWRWADDVLEDQGFTGVVFPITGRVGTHRPYYLTWQELDRLRDSGRWEVESHTRMGHDRIAVDDAGTRSPFLINRAWLADEGRLESPDEFAARVAGDLDGSADDLVAHGFGAPRLFAFPFSAETNPTNDPDAPATTQGIVGERFAASMTNVVPDRLVAERDRARRSLPRLEVFRSTTTEDLARRIAAATPTAPGPEQPLTEPAAWTDTAGEPLVAGSVTPDVDQGSEVTGVTFDGTALRLAPPDDGYLGVRHAPGRSADWSGYDVVAEVTGLGATEGGPTGSVFALVGSDQTVQVAVSATYARVTTGADGPAPVVVAEQNLEAADAHRIELRVAGDRVEVIVDGTALASTPLAPGATGGLALAASNGPVTFAGLSLTAAGS